MKYVALLRGIAPMNPNMRNDKLRSVFEELGFQNVQTVISSGNVLFESPLRNVTALETLIEQALPERLGFVSTTIIRSQGELQSLVKRNPFKGIEDTPKSRLNVTFLKNNASVKLNFLTMRRTRLTDCWGIMIAPSAVLLISQDPKHRI